MTVAAVMTQSMRAAHCAAYLQRLGNERAVLIVSDAGPLAAASLPPHVSIHEAAPSPHVMSPVDLAVAKTRTRLLQWTRSGVLAGPRVERLARRTAWSLRYMERIPRAIRSLRPTSKRPAPSADRSGVIASLERIHAETPLDTIVAFDVFDLPDLLQFGEQHRVSVIVR